MDLIPCQTREVFVKFTLFLLCMVFVAATWKCSRKENDMFPCGACENVRDFLTQANKQTNEQNQIMKKQKHRKNNFYLYEDKLSPCHVISGAKCIVRGYFSNFISVLLCVEWIWRQFSFMFVNFGKIWFRKREHVGNFSWKLRNFTFLSVWLCCIALHRIVLHRTARAQFKLFKNTISMMMSHIAAHRPPPYTHIVFETFPTNENFLFSVFLLFL